MLLDDLKNKLAESLRVDSHKFSYPPNPELGDLSLACFDLDGFTTKNPAAASVELAEQLKKEESVWLKYFSEIKPVGPYLNFFIKPSYLAREIISDISRLQGRYGQNSFGKKHQVMIEYSNGNTHKEYHIGHLRNIAYGDAVNHLLSANGYKSIPVSYINDFGINVAKTIWNWRRDSVWEERPEPKGFLLGRCYAKASQKLRDNPEGKLEVGAIMKNIESRQGDDYKFWRISRKWSLDYFDSIYKELNVKFQRTFYESAEITEGLEIVKDLTAKGILKKSQGAIIADLSEYDLGVLPIIRSDGTALYPVGDLALASKKIQGYNLTESIYVVDVRQSLYFKQLFKILDLMGYHQKLIHLTYDFVTLPGGMMASRTGNIITYQELKDKIAENLIRETKQRHRGWSEAKIAKVVEVLTIATMKFEMLKVGADKVITFNIEEAAKFDGYTACYIEYGYARLRSILRKGRSFWMTRVDFKVLEEKKEKILLLKLAKYPEIIRLAGAKYNPSELAKYLFELTQLANDYYHAVNILKAAPKLKYARLALIKSVSRVLRSGCAILGFSVLEKM